MPIFRSRIALAIARRLRAFVNLDPDLTRSAVPNSEPLHEQSKHTRNRISRLRERLSNKDRQLKQMQERLSEKSQQVAALRVRQQSDGLDIGSAAYHSDSLAVWRKDVSFLHEPTFREAYQMGMNSGHKLGREKGSNVDIHIEWRVYVACWAAWHAKHLPGSFVECGVNTGIFSLAVCSYIDFNSTGKDFFLFDTFEGIPEEQMAEQERDDNRVRVFRKAYEECYDIARRNFEPFPKARLVRGKVPDTLDSVNIDEVCYLSLDMNIAEPEIAAIEFFWDKLVSGAPLLLDDYGWLGHSLQKEKMDEFACEKGVKILTMPTGQGLLIKP